MEKLFNLKHYYSLRLLESWICMWVVAEQSLHLSLTIQVLNNSLLVRSCQRHKGFKSLKNVKELLRTELDEQSEICVLASLLVFLICLYIFSLALTERSKSLIPTLFCR